MADGIFGDLPRVFTREQKAEIVKRELAMRRRVYPRWVQAGKMTQKKADEEIAGMEAILGDYQ